MAKKQPVVLEATASVTHPVEQPYVLVEGFDGAEPYRLLAERDRTGERTFVADGQTYEVCGAVGYRWVYRRMAF